MIVWECYNSLYGQQGYVPDIYSSAKLNGLPTCAYSPALILSGFLLFSKRVGGRGCTMGAM